MLVTVEAPRTAKGCVAPRSCASASLLEATTARPSAAATASANGLSSFETLLSLGRDRFFGRPQRLRPVHMALPIDLPPPLPNHILTRGNPRAGRVYWRKY